MARKGKIWIRVRGHYIFVYALFVPPRHHCWDSLNSDTDDHVLYTIHTSCHGGRPTASNVDNISLWYLSRGVCGRLLVPSKPVSYWSDELRLAISLRRIHFPTAPSNAPGTAHACTDDYSCCTSHNASTRDEHSDNVDSICNSRPTSKINDIHYLQSQSLCSGQSTDNGAFQLYGE
jgi:hypothetical protein